MSKLAWVAASLAIAAGLHAEPAAKITLQRRFNARQVNYYILEHDEISRQSFSLLPIPMVEQRNCTDALIERIVRVRPDGSADIEWNLDRVQYKKTGQQGDVRWDSAGGMNPVPDTQAATMLLGQTLRAVQKPVGELETPPSASSSAPATARAPATRHVPSPLVRHAAQRGQGGFYEPEHYQRVLARLAGEFLPPMPVAVGESWRMRFEEQKPAFGTLVHHLRYTLKSAGGAAGAQTAVIGVEGDCTIEPPADVPGANKVKSTITLKRAKWTGEIQFDLDKGRVRTATLRHENDISSVMSGGESNMTFNLGLAEERTLRLRSVDKLPPKPIRVQATRPATGAGGAARTNPQVQPRVQPQRPVGGPATRPTYNPRVSGSRPASSRPMR